MMLTASVKGMRISGTGQNRVMTSGGDSAVMIDR